MKKFTPLCRDSIVFRQYVLGIQVVFVAFRPRRAFDRLEHCPAQSGSFRGTHTLWPICSTKRSNHRFAFVDELVSYPDLVCTWAFRKIEGPPFTNSKGNQKEPLPWSTTRKSGLGEQGQLVLDEFKSKPLKPRDTRTCLWDNSSQHPFAFLSNQGDSEKMGYLLFPFQPTPKTYSKYPVKTGRLF